MPDDKPFLPKDRGRTFADGLFTDFTDPMMGPVIDLYRNIPFTVTSHKPGTPGFVPPPPRPFGESAGVEPPYQETYRRRVRPLDEMPYWPDSLLPKKPEDEK